MAKLLYFVTASLNGYITDDQGRFGWAEPDNEVHQFVNDLFRDAGTHLYGRRMYETMKVWETEPGLAQESPILADFAGVWQQAEKIVYSTTLSEVETSRTRLERSFDPEAVRQLVASSRRDVVVAGPTLAAEAFRAGLVDECHLILVPIIVPAGTRFLPDDVRLELDLLNERRFDSGMVYLHYQTRKPAIERDGVSS